MPESFQKSGNPTSVTPTQRPWVTNLPASQWQPGRARGPEGQEVVCPHPPSRGFYPGPQEQQHRWTATWSSAIAPRTPHAQVPRVP